jgi:UTP:GlnB (protein PII) uridylyltransferase
VVDTHALARCHVTPWLRLDPIGHCLQFYVRPRGGVQTFDESRAARLRAMVVASVQRRHPKGLKVHVHSVDRYGCLAALTRVLKAANLSVTRAKVRLQEAIVMLPAVMQCLRCSGQMICC